MRHQTLYSLLEGEIGTVTKIKSTGDMRRRLFDLGIIEGTKIQCMFKSPYDDPVAYRIRNSVFALRSEDATDILIQ